MASVIEEGVSMQHQWNDDDKRQNRINRTTPCLRATYPPDIPYVESLFENRAYVLTDWRLTASGTARTRIVAPVIYCC